MPRTVPSGPCRIVLRHRQHLLHAGADSLQSAFQFGENAVAFDGRGEPLLPTHQFVLMRFLPAADFGQLILRRGARHPPRADN